MLTQAVVAKLVKVSTVKIETENVICTATVEVNKERNKDRVFWNYTKLQHFTRIKPNLISKLFSILCNF